MLNHDEQSAINLTGDEPAPLSISDISAAQTPDTQPGTNRNSATEWIQRAIAGIRQMHADESVRSQVAKRLF
jgi:hypothetical protein